MMQDVTPFFLEASRIRNKWTKSELRRLLTKVHQATGQIVDWDELSGENWARLLVEDKVKSIICVNAPICISVDDNIEQFTTITDVVLIRIQDWEHTEYRLEVSVVATLFPDWMWRLETADVDQLTMQDLWWATV